MKNSTKQTFFYILMFLAMLTWGGSWTSAKLIANTTSPEVLVFWRFLATFVSFIPVFLFLKPDMKIDRRSLIFVVLGAVFLVLYNKLFFTGLKTGLAGAGGVLVTTLNPVFTFLISAVLIRQKIKLKEWIGLVLGFTGGLIILEIWSISTDKILMGGNLLFLAASCVWALLTIVTHKVSGIPSMVYSFYIYGLSALFDFFLTLPGNSVTEVFEFGWAFWLNIIYISVGATTFGTTAYFYASIKVGASKASSFIFLVPTSAVIFSWIILKEVPSLSTIIGGILALSAVYLINAKHNRKSIPEDEAAKEAC